jgi:fatty-acyl-CoA synthase
MLGRLPPDPISPPPIALDEEAIARASHDLAGELARTAAPGDRIAVLCGTRPEMVAARDAAAQRGLAVVPLYPQLAAPELAHILAHAGPRALLVEAGLRAAAGEALDRLPAERPTVIELAAVNGLSVASGLPRASSRPGAVGLDVGATLLYTSGTTGRPKGCVRTAAQEAARADELTATYSLGADDVHLIACPLAFSAPGILLRAARRAGAATVLLPRFSPEAFLAAVEACRATFFFLVPTQYQRLLALPESVRRLFDLSSVRAAVVAGAPMPPALRRAIVEWLGPDRLWEFYGSSETGTVSVLRPDEQLVHAESVGRPVGGVDLRLVGDPAAAEIFVRSPTVMAGYWNAASGSIDWPGTADGFLSVGDLGAMDGGVLRLVDRVHDTIISGGINVYPAEVERALHEHPAVAGAVVFGVPDPDWHQAVAAVVVRADGSSIGGDDLRSFLRGLLAPHKIPKQFAFVSPDELPKSPSGKPLRRAAAALLRR